MELREVSGDPLTDAKYALYSLVGFNRDRGSVIFYASNVSASVLVNVSLSVNSGPTTKSIPKSFILVTFSAKIERPSSVFIYPAQSDYLAHYSHAKTLAEIGI